MDLQHGLALAGEALTAFSVLLTFLGTVRNLLTHANVISTAEATKFGKFLDRCSWVQQKGSAAIASLPGLASKVGLTAVPPPPPSKGDAGFVKVEAIAINVGVMIVVWGILIALMSLCGTGCATSFTKPGATGVQKFQDDLAAARQVEQDIKANCPKLAPIAGLLGKAAAVAADPYNLLNDFLAAVSAIPDVKQDYDAVKCAVKVVLDDYKKLRPQTSGEAQKVARIVANLESVLGLLGGDPGPACVASL